MGRPRVRYTLIITLLIILGVTAGLWFLVVSPRMARAADINAQAEQMAVANTQLYARYGAVVKQAKGAPATAAQAQDEFSKMPEQANLPAVITELTDAAKAAGIPANQIEIISTSLPAAVVPDGQDPDVPAVSGINLARMEVGMNVTGSPQHVTDFLANLEKLDRAFLITGTSSTWQQEPGKPVKVAMQVQGSMFVLQSKLPDLVAQVQSLLTQASVQPSA
jgi:Tfp pilus assembly protein PilO